MPRKKRIWYPGATYHIMSRGNRKMAVFLDPLDYVIFMEILNNVKDRFPFLLHAACLMTNHFHFLMETIDTDPGKILQIFLSTYAENFNRRHDFCGHLFEGRYTSCMVDSDRYFLEVSRYIHLNPVKAQIVKTPGAYKYSSYNLFVSDTRKPHTSCKNKIETIMSQIVTTDRVLEFFGPKPLDEYRAFVEGENSHADEEMMIQQDIRENNMWLPL